ncbi:MAG: hypothetical protein IJW23_04075 [Lentisphaeria bacterium]|nr:hypothetical protein [Lentisphaeria bacterium]
MKKTFLIMTVFLSAMIIFSGCGKSKSSSLGESETDTSAEVQVPEKFVSKLPKDIEAVGYIDGKELVSSKSSAELLKMLFGEDFDINMLNNKYYLAGSTKGMFLAIYVQSENGNAEKVFKYLNKNVFKKGDGNTITADGISIRLIDNNSLFAVAGNDIKGDFGENSPLFAKLNKDQVISLFFKPSDLKALPGVSGVIKEMKLPELYQLESISLDIADVAGSMKIVATFKDAESARKVKTFAENIINAEIRKDDPEFADGLNLSVSGNKIILTSKHSIIDILNNALKSARLYAQAANSIGNMKQIGMAIKSYSINDNKNPNTLNDLIKSGVLTDTTVFIAPFDTISKRAKTGEQLTPRNTSYAYLGKGINTYDATAPVMIVKPWLLPKGVAMEVLYGDGSVRSFFDIKGPCSMSCRDVVEMICKKNYISSDVRAILLRNAEAEDRSRY